MRFIVANYGPRHVGMLLAHLQSVAQTHPQAAVSVYWQDLPAAVIDALRAAFSQVDFIETALRFDRDQLQRISSKVRCWTRAIEEHSGELVFADSDTLVRGDLSGYLAKREVDLVFTTKTEERVPLNTGVMLTTANAASRTFFRRWSEETEHILKTPELFAQANDRSLPYGGTDQMSFQRIVGYERTRESYTVPIEDQCVRLHAEPCAVLNETNSRPLSTPEGRLIRVVHYKGGWQRILLDGRPFSPARPRQSSWEMLAFFFETFASALARVNAAAQRNFTARDFGIVWPWYLRDGRLSWPGYAAWRVKEAAKRAWLASTGQLTESL